MVSCKLCKCSRGTKFSLEHNVMFHKFPANPNMKRKWMEFIATQLYGFNLEQRTVIYLCSLHFDQNCYLKSDTGQLHLKKNSIPTIPFTYQDREVHNKSKYSEKSQAPENETVQFREEIIISSLADDVPDSSLQFNQNEFDLGAQILNLSDKVEDLTKRSESVRSLRAKINFLRKKVARKEHEVRFWKRKCLRMRRVTMAPEKVGNKAPAAVSIFIVNKK